MDKALIVVDLRLFSVWVVRDLRKFLDVHWAMVLLRPTLLVRIREREQEGNVQQWQARELLASEGLEYIVLGFYSRLLGFFPVCHHC
ncbi:hypothetical protein H5410_052635 [Solanum commersonii]|uniref:Uncharacterized protein n=1 Tax=Solanum commersonii TaxID=4109 RepID=A0A9J5X4P2_SOLCO|nr:hypothetical protein H5410_052635 [Solanum commersonii]